MVFKGSFLPKPSYDSMTLFTSFSKASGRAAGLGISILPIPLCCERVVVRDIIFPLFLQKAEQDVSRQPEGKHLLPQQQGKSGDVGRASVRKSCQNKGWTCA